MTASTVLLSLTSGLIGAILTSLLYVRYEGRKIKRDVARRLMANRHHVTGDEFTRALNEVYVIFSNDPDVINALKLFHDAVITNQQALIRPRMIALFKAVMRSSGIDPTRVGDAFFATPFNVRTDP